MKQLTGLLLIFSVLNAQAQSPATINQESLAADSAVSTYFTVRGETLPLYNGRQFGGGYSGIKGSPYYRFNDWQIGEVQYEGTWYHNIPVIYDIYRDELLVKHPNGSPLVLFGERVQEFRYAGMTFVRLPADKDGIIKSGFYERMATGRLSIYVRRARIMEEKIVDMTVEKEFFNRYRYFALINNEFHAFSKQKQLLSLVKESRNSIQQDLKKNKLRFKTKPEEVMARIAEFYNQSNK